MADHPSRILPWPRASASGSRQIRALGRYAIVGRISTGGTATVYLARVHGTGGFTREFALKVVHPELAETPGFAERFTREARLASRVRHPNVVATIDAGVANGFSYLALELVDGVTLRHLLLYRSMPLPWVAAAQAMADAAHGLHALHVASDEHGTKLGIVHRDLSPHNIMVDQEGRAILIDLGLAKDDSTENTQVGVMCGKLPYMSPEQAQLLPIDARSDVFAIGTVLYELVTGMLPFGDSHTTATLERLVRCDHEALARNLQVYGVPPGIASVILACLQRDPDARPSTALAVAEALTQELQHGGHDASDNRRRLSELVRGALPEHGRVVPVSGIDALHSRQPVARMWQVAAVAFAASLGTVALAWPTDASTVPERAPISDPPRSPELTSTADEAAVAADVAGSSITAPVAAPMLPAAALDTTMLVPEGILPAFVPAVEVGVPVRNSPRRGSRPAPAAALKPNPYR